MIYRDTADLSSREKTSIYSYKEFSDDYQNVLRAELMTMKPRQNNRDGVPLRLLAEALAKAAHYQGFTIDFRWSAESLTRLHGKKGREDIQQVIADYERQGVIFLAAAIG